MLFETVIIIIAFDTKLFKRIVFREESISSGRVQVSVSIHQWFDLVYQSIRKPRVYLVDIQLGKLLDSVIIPFMMLVVFFKEVNQVVAVLAC